MIIGIDFDNTLVDTKEASKKYLDVFRPGNKLNSYHDLPLEDEIEFFNRYAIEITENSKLFPGVKEAFAFFKENNIKAILITARSDDKQVSATKNRLEKEGLLFDKCYFGKSSGFSTKESICMHENVNLMIDDMDSVLKGVYLSNIKVLKYGEKSEEYPYAIDWYEVIDFIRKEFYENS